MPFSGKLAIRTAIGLGAVASLTALTACGSGGSDSSSSSSGKITGQISFQTWNLRAGYKDYFTGLIKDFEKQHPGAKVKWIDQPADNYAEKLSSDASAGTLPDVVNVSPDLSSPLAKAGVLLNLDKDPVAAKYKAQYTDAAWKGDAIPGQDGTYSFPWYLNTGPMFYNKTLFKQAGLDANKPPKTYDELFQDANKIATNSHGKIATLAGTPTIEDFGQYGVQLMSADGTKFTYNSAKGVQLLTQYKKLYDNGGLDSQALTSTPDQKGQKFKEQKVAMNPGSAYNLQDFKENAPSLYKNLGISNVPNNTGHQNMYVQSLGVSKTAKNKATAVAFAAFVTNQKNQEAFAHKVTVFPSTKGSLDKPYWSKEDGTDEGRVRVASAKQLKTAINYTPPVMTDEMKTVLQQEIAKCMQGKESPKQALDNAVAQSNKLLQQG
ncbi:ABC transporter substrate-binding protein [Mangrovactinospora gilvigrisea]|uniref:ABC transporter substrate-binding protein n=1 Tax=Mangrovactinospora gilvigrisea TaxID=1428644 RepID=A0A1J7BC32_9ACTN|nr:extracellular solute-binding protein [Mangrovactinospora gilvigrisea]OIV36149.1 ABC transporter substrate-binding protein [Mangrovactinospora gilvigrisea]